MHGFPPTGPYAPGQCRHSRVEGQLGTWRSTGPQSASELFREPLGGGVASSGHGYGCVRSGGSPAGSLRWLLLERRHPSSAAGGSETPFVGRALALPEVRRADPLVRQRARVLMGRAARQGALLRRPDRGALSARRVAHGGAVLGSRVVAAVRSGAASWRHGLRLR